jgi:hypothetical protein
MSVVSYENVADFATAGYPTSTDAGSVGLDSSGGKDSDSPPPVAAPSQATNDPAADNATRPENSDDRSALFLDLFAVGRVPGTTVPGGRVTAGGAGMSAGPVGETAGIGAAGLSGGPVTGATWSDSSADATRTVDPGSTGGNTFPLLNLFVASTDRQSVKSPAAAPALHQQAPAAGVPQNVNPQQTARLEQHFSNLPLTFEANIGQADSRVQFLAHGAGYTAFFTETGSVLELDGASAHAAVGFQLAGSNTSSAAAGQELLPARTNYLLGNDPAGWHTNVPNYAQVVYPDVYPGVNLVYHSPGQQQLEYDFNIAPGADPRQIHLIVSGAQGLSLNANGDLVIHTAAGELVQHAPVITQQRDGGTIPIAGHFVVQSDNQVGFEVGAYDASRPLVIDPSYAYSTYLGDLHDVGNAIAVDGNGNAYMVGYTTSANFPTSANHTTTYPSLQTTLPFGSQDAFVSELNSQGTGLIYSTYFGGLTQSTTSANAVALLYIPAEGVYNLFFTGSTNATDLPNTFSPLSNPPADTGDPTLQTGGSMISNVFVTRLNSQGTLGEIEEAGDNDDQQGEDVGYSRYYSGTIGGYYTGNVPGPVYFRDVNGVLQGAFSYNWFTGHAAYGIAVDNNVLDATFGYAYLTGGAVNTVYAIATHDPILAPSDPGHVKDVFVAVFAYDGTLGNVFQYANAYGTIHNYTTFGGTGFAADSSQTPDNNTGGEDVGTGIALDSANNLYVAGYTDSYNTGNWPAQDFPIVRAYSVEHLDKLGLDNESPGSYRGNSTYDAFVARFNTSTAHGALPDYSVYSGGNANDQSGGITMPHDAGVHGNPVAVYLDNNGKGHAFITGATDETNVSPAANTLLSSHTLGNAAPPYLPISTSSAQSTQDTTFSPIDAFVAEIDFDPTPVVPLAYIDYQTFLGSYVDDKGTGIALDSAHNALVTGWTGSPDNGIDDFPTTANAIQSSYNGMFDAFITEVNPLTNPTQWLYSSFLGGDFWTEGTGIAVGPSNGNVFTTGMTASDDFPTTPGVVQPTHGWPLPSAGQYNNAFITVTNPN